MVRAGHVDRRHENQFDRLFAELGHDGGSCTVNDTASMLTLAPEGIGLSYGLASAAKPHIRGGELKQVLKDASPVLPGFHVYYTSRRQVPMKLRCFVEFMRRRAE